MQSTLEVFALAALITSQVAATSLTAEAALTAFTATEERKAMVLLPPAKDVASDPCCENTVSDPANPKNPNKLYTHFSYWLWVGLDDPKVDTNAWNSEACPGYCYYAYPDKQGGKFISNKQYRRQGVRPKCDYR